MTLLRRPVRGSPQQTWVSTVFRLVLGVVFLAAGLLKVGHPDASVRAVSAYDVLPADLARYLGYALPGIEIALALLVLVGLFTRVAAAALGVLLIAFIAGISQAWARGLTIDCGCFGGGGTIAAKDTNYLPEILRDLGLLVTAAWLTWRPASRFALDHPVPADTYDLDDDLDDEADAAAETPEDTRA
jgi:uncharacterized membrane protein YphA (DoxX/SURF4 family)